MQLILLLLLEAEQFVLMPTVTGMVLVTVTVPGTIRCWCWCALMGPTRVEFAHNAMENDCELLWVRLWLVLLWFVRVSRLLVLILMLMLPRSVSLSLGIFVFFGLWLAEEYGRVSVGVDVSVDGFDLVVSSALGTGGGFCFCSCWSIQLSS